MTRCRTGTRAMVLGAFLIFSGCRDDEQILGPSETGDLSGEDPTDGDRGARALSMVEMASILQVANDNSIALGELGIEKARDPAVRELALRMVEDHRRAARRQALIAGAIGLHNEPNDEVRELLGMRAAARTRLENESSSSFDRALIDETIRAHAELLGLIDRAELCAIGVTRSAQLGDGNDPGADDTGDRTGGDNRDPSESSQDQDLPSGGGPARASGCIDEGAGAQCTSAGSNDPAEMTSTPFERLLILERAATVAHLVEARFVERQICEGSVTPPLSVP
jgi:predicted outer membrane protein